MSILFSYFKKNFLFFTLTLLLICLGASSSEATWDHEKIIADLLSCGVKKIVKNLPEDKGYVLELENGTLAVFKPRNKEKSFRETLSYEMSVRLFGLDHTVAPTVPKEYKDKEGIFQLYVKPAFMLRDDSYQAISNANRMSYADLQTFLFSVAMEDLNEDAIIPWENENGKINFTHVDGEYLFMDTEEKYGNQSPAFEDYLDDYRTGLPHRAFLSKFTKFYNPSTLDQMKKIDRESILKVWSFVEEKYGLIDAIDLESKERYINRTLSNIKTILKHADKISSNTSTQN